MDYYGTIVDVYLLAGKDFRQNVNGAHIKERAHTYQQDDACQEVNIALAAVLFCQRETYVANQRTQRGWTAVCLPKKVYALEDTYKQVCQE